MCCSDSRRNQRTVAGWQAKSLVFEKHQITQAGLPHNNDFNITGGNETDWSDDHDDR